MIFLVICFILHVVRQILGVNWVVGPYRFFRYYYLKAINLFHEQAIAGEKFIVISAPIVYFLLLCLYYQSSSNLSNENLMLQKQCTAGQRFTGGFDNLVFMVEYTLPHWLSEIFFIHFKMFVEPFFYFMEYLLMRSGKCATWITPMARFFSIDIPSRREMRHSFEKFHIDYNQTVYLKEDDFCNRLTMWNT